MLRTNPEPRWPNYSAWSASDQLTVDGSTIGFSDAVEGILRVEVPAAIRTACIAAGNTAGECLRITGRDGFNPIYHAIEDTTQSTWVLHCKPKLNAGETKLNLYGGNADALDISNKIELTRGYAGYWSLGDSASPALDWTQYGNDGTQSGGVTFGATGKVGKCCSFDGSDDYVTVTRNATILPDYVTVLCLIKSTDTSASHIVSNGYNSLGCSVYVGDGKHYFELTTETGRTTGNSGQSPSGNWEHLALTYDGVNAKLYLEGVLKSSPSKAGAIVYHAANDLVLAARANISQAWEGLLDNVAILPRAMTADEIKLAAIAPDNANLSWSG